MKKLYLLLILGFLLITGCSSSTLKSISLDELNSKMENKGSFVLYFSDDNDYELENTLVKALEQNNLSGFKINTSKLSDEEKNKLQISIAYETPSIIFIIDGKDPTKLSHVTSSTITTREIVARLKDMNFIKEEK